MNCVSIAPEDVTIMDKSDFEKVHFISQLDEEDKTIVFKMVTCKKFKDFFNKNVAAL